MLALLKQVFRLFKGHYRPLVSISSLITLQKIGDLIVPLIAAEIIDRIAASFPMSQVHLVLAGAFVFWVLHGNVIPYAFESRDIRRFGLPVRRDLSVRVLDRVLQTPLRRFAEAHGGAADSRLLQAQIEIGERVVADFMAALFRTVIPMLPTGLVSIAILIHYIPNLGLLVLFGGCLDVLITILINRVLSARFRALQRYDNTRRGLHLAIFSDYEHSRANREDVVRSYAAAYGDYADNGVDTWLMFQRLTLVRGLVVNIVNAVVWGIGIAYLYQGGYTLGYFLMFTSWSTRVIEFFYTCLNIQKLWIETRPAMEIFFDILGRAAQPAAPHGDCGLVAMDPGFGRKPESRPGPVARRSAGGR